MGLKCDLDIHAFDRAGNKQPAAATGGWDDEEGFVFVNHAATELAVGAVGSRWSGCTKVNNNKRNSNNLMYIKNEK